MADEVIVNVAAEETPVAEIVAEEIAVENANDENEEEETEWREVREALASCALAARNQADALSAMNRELEELKNRVPADLQQMMGAQQETIQVLVAEALATVRVNLSTPNQEPVVLVEPDKGAEAALPAQETKSEERKESLRKRRRI